MAEKCYQITLIEKKVRMVMSVMMMIVKKMAVKMMILMK